ncbi:MAG: Ig-like domain-containing protein, partial [Ruminococcus sp.]
MRAKRFVSIILSLLIVCSSFAGLTVFAEETNYTALSNSTVSTEVIEHYIAGEAGLCNGVLWNQKSEINKMTAVEDGSYEITITGVQPKSDGTPYEYKVTTNGSWDPAYGYDGLIGPGGANVQLMITEADSTVKIVLTKDLYVEAYVNDVKVSPDPVETTYAPPATTNEIGETSGITYGGGFFYPPQSVKCNRYFLYMPVDVKDSSGNVHNWKTFTNATATCYWWDGKYACESWQKSYQMKASGLDNIYYIDVPINVGTIVFSNGIDGGLDPEQSAEPNPNWGKNCQTVNIGTDYYSVGENPNYPEGTTSFNNMIYIVDVNNISRNELSLAPTYGGEWRYLHADGSIDYTKGTIFEPMGISITTSKRNITLNNGTSTSVKTTVKGEDYGYTTEWKSDNPDIAEVDQNGNITAKNKGTAIITVKAQNPGNETDVAQAKIIVNVVDFSDGKVTGKTENCTWTYDDADGTMTISGTGNMGSYTDVDQPWYEFKSSIKKLIISDSVSNIGQYTFNDCINLTSVTISNSVTSIGYNAFENCTNLEDVYYIGTSAEWNRIRFGLNNNCLLNANINFVDVVKPTAKITSTKDIDNKQTVTLTLNDDIGIFGYYWGESSDYQNNPFTETSKYSVTKTISNPGTYYLTVKDINGNVSDTVSITFYKISLKANGGDISPTYILASSGNSIDLPVPTKNGYIFIGWAKENADTGYFFETITPTSNATYYAIWQSTGLEKQNQSIDCASSAYAKTYGDKPFNLNAKAETALSYASDNKSVVEVSADGTVTIKGAGTATITITAEETNNYNSATATVEITVNKASQKVTGFEQKYEVTFGDKPFSLNAIAETALSYVSDNTSVAEVSADGTVTIKGAGKSTITIIAEETANYKSATATVEIIVNKVGHEVSVDKQNYKLTYGAKPFNLNAKAETALSYVSSNPKVANVSADGTVTIKGAGTATITITAEETENYTSATATVKITVAKATQKITGVKTQYVTSAGKSFTLKPKAKTKLTYSSSNKNVAVVSSTGKVTVKAGGYAYITVKASDNGNYKSAYAKTKIISAPRDFTSKDVYKVKKTGTTKAKITWKSLAGATGYTVQLATNKSYKGANTVKNSKNTAILTGLNKGKTYYVRISAYTKVSGKNYSNKWYTVK